MSESAIPSLQETFARVLRNENIQSPPNPDHNSALVSRGGFRGGFRGGSRGGYRAGTRGGHTDRTIELRATIPESDNVECYYCHEFGHTKRTLRSFWPDTQGARLRMLPLRQIALLLFRQKNMHDFWGLKIPLRRLLHLLRQVTLPHAYYLLPPNGSLIRVLQTT